MTPAVALKIEPTTKQNSSTRYADRVNPRWVELLDVLGMNAVYTRCRGAELSTADGRTIIDFLSGYCVYNPGHNHSGILAALESELRRIGPTMLQSHVPPLAAELAERLCALAGGHLRKVFFTSSGSEGIETVMKFARAHTRRSGFLYSDGAFHGLTTGALSIMGSASWREGFGPLLPDTTPVPFGEIDPLADALATRRHAAFIVEPIQAESGIRLPPPGYLAEAQRLCRRHGTLFILDEVQTGLYRTGPFLAAHHFGLDPDMVVLAKALSGGLVPCGAVLMNDAVSRSVYGSVSRAFIHASTFGENALAMRAGLATLEVMEQERMGERAATLGAALRDRLAKRIGHHDMVAGVRGLGMLNGIVFRPPRRLAQRIPYGAFTRIHDGMFGQMIVSRLFRTESFLTQMCGNDHMVLKVTPPLIVSEAQIDAFVEAAGRVVDAVHDGLSFWKEGITMVQRAVHI